MILTHWEKILIPHVKCLCFTNALSFLSLVPPFTSTCKPSKLDTFIPSWGWGWKEKSAPGIQLNQASLGSRTLRELALLPSLSRTPVWNTELTSAEVTFPPTRAVSFPLLLPPQLGHPFFLAQRVQFRCFSPCLPGRGARVTFKRAL